jgi:SnoaL-like domain
MSDAAILARLEALEAESAIRRLVARYFAICDELGPDTPFAELGELFTADALWEGRGRYAKAFGHYEGRAAIVAMIRSYCLPSPHFAMTGHFFSAEDIVVESSSARGQWMMLQTSDYADGKSDFRAARLTMRFALENGCWRIAHFLTQNIFSRQAERWNDEASIPVPEGGSGAEQ